MIRLAVVAMLLSACDQASFAVRQCLPPSTAYPAPDEVASEARLIELARMYEIGFERTPTDECCRVEWLSRADRPIEELEDQRRARLNAHDAGIAEYASVSVEALDRSGGLHTSFYRFDKCGNSLDSPRGRTSTL